MSPKFVEIDVDPVRRPRVPMIVASPGEEVIFKSNNGHSTFFFPNDIQIFEKTGPVVFDVSPENGEVTLQVWSEIFNNLATKEDNLATRESVERHGALFVEYAVHCRDRDGTTYFAEGNSAPRIIIPKP